MKLKARNIMDFLSNHPRVLLNLIGLLTALAIFVGGFLYYALKPIDVLKDWTVTTSLKGEDGGLPVYHPSGTLEFVSKSTKLIDGEANFKRVIDCDALGTLSAREIELTQTVGNREPGKIQARESSVVVPAVGEFNGLPRKCRLLITGCYENVILWRDHCESARSNDFLVTEDDLNAAEVQRQIEALRLKIRDLESKLVSVSDSNSGSSTTSTTTTNTNTTTDQNGGSSSNSTSTTTEKPSTPAPQYREVCDIDTSILFIPVKLNCRQEQV